MLLLVSLVYSSHTLERPWDTYAWAANNSYITFYGSEQVWEVNIFDLTLDSMALSHAAGLSYTDDALAVEGYLSAAREKRDEALQYRDQCNDEIRISLATHQLLDLLGDVAGLTLGFVGYLIKTLIALNPSILDELPGCLLYDDAWKLSMNASMKALEESLHLEKTASEKTGDALNTVLEAGICQPDYPGAARNQCSFLLNAWQDIRAQEDALDAQIVLVKNENQKSLPNGAAYAAAMEMLWEGEGLMYDLKQLEHLSITTFNQAKDEYTTLQHGAEQLQVSVNGRINELESQQLDKIASSPFVVSMIETGEERNVQLAWEEIQETQEDTNALIREAEWVYRSERSDYLRDSTLTLQQAVRSYAELQIRMDHLESNAQQTVQQMRERAVTEINAVQAVGQQRPVGAEAEAERAQAESYLESGDRASSWGVAYESYREAARHAATALAMAQGYSHEQQASFDTYEISIQDFLTRAERDGLDVTMEKVEFRLVKGHREPWALEILESIEQSIFEKARLRYGYLERVRRELFVVLRLSPDFNDIVQTVTEVEGDGVENGQIQYRQALGNLKAMEEVYEEANQRWMEEKDRVVELSLESDVIWTVERPQLDVPADIYVNVLVYNPTALTGERMPVRLNVPRTLALTEDDVVSGEEHLLQLEHSGDTLVLTFSTMEKKTRYDVVIEKQKILAQTTSRTVQAYGQPDGSAEIQERIAFEMEHPHALDYPQSDITIDGLPYRGRLLAVGGHILESEYDIDDAFDWWTGDYQAIRLGMTTRLEYNLYVRPSIDLDRTYLFLSQDNGSITQFRVLSATGERIRNKQFVGNGMLSLELDALEADKTAQFHISLDLQDVRAYIEERIAFLSDSDSEAVNDLVAQARAALEQGQEEDALEFIQEAQHQWDREQRERLKDEEKYQELLHSLQEEIRALENALNSSSDHSILESLRIRRDLLEAELGTRPNETLPQTIDRLKEVDTQWDEKELKQLVKDSYKEYERIREEFLAAGQNLTGPQMVQFEDRLRTLEVTNQLDDLPAFLSAYDEMQRLAEENRQGNAATLESLRAQFTTLQLQLEQQLNRYKAEKRQAENTHWESWFTENEEEIEQTLDDAETALRRGETAVLQEKLPVLEEQHMQLTAVLDGLKEETERKIRNAERIFNEKQASFSEQDQEWFGERIARMHALANDGEYVKALKLYETFVNALPEIQAEQNMLLIILGVTAILILALLIGYMYKQMHKGPKFPPKWKPLKKFKSKSIPESD